MHEIKAGLFSLSMLLANSSAFAQLPSGPHYLDTDGYLRTGIGASEGGAPQAEFQAPGAQVEAWW